MDKYDAAIEYLTRHPREIRKAWVHTETHEAGCLFQPCCKSGIFDAEAQRNQIGCLTMIRDCPDMYVAETPDLTERILKDRTLPPPLNALDMDNIKPRHLQAFAQWQRVIDKELGRSVS